MTLYLIPRVMVWAATTVLVLLSLATVVLAAAGYALYTDARPRIECGPGDERTTVIIKRVDGVDRCVAHETVGWGQAPKGAVSERK